MQVKGLKQQAGISLVGLIVVLAILGFIGVLAMKIVPTYSEYRAISAAIVKAKSAGTTAMAIQDSFNRSAEVNYISTLSGRDLIISRENGEVEVSFAYEKKIPLFGPASLLLEYSGSTSKNGPPAKND
jgi:type II secretory pathway pseudopilin PulG